MATTDGTAEPDRYRLFSVEHSYFSAKVRAYLRWKDHHGALPGGFEDVLATTDLIRDLLTVRSGSPSLPQLEAPDGTWVQDTSSIIDFVEEANPEPPVVPPASTSPRQCLVSYLLEMLGDEWMLVMACWQRWQHTVEDGAGSHRAHNEQQWGSWLAPERPGPERRAAGADFFEKVFGISAARSEPKGPFAGLVDLGVDETTIGAWTASQDRLLDRLETHFGIHDYLLGGAPSLADFSLLGPLYVHYYRDAGPGYRLRTAYPLVAEWVERTNRESALNARSYGQRLYSLDPDSGALVGRPATSDGGALLPDDEIPESLLAIIEIFFDEMWPVLRSSAAALAKFIASDRHQAGAELPRKSFTATPGFLEHQTADGALTHEFVLHGVRGRRMVVPYQIWMLQRLADVVASCTSDVVQRAAVETMLARWPRGTELLKVDDLLADCRIRKEGGLLFSV